MPRVRRSRGPVSHWRLLWLPAFFGLWMLFVGEWTFQIAVWGVGASLVALAGAEAAARRGMLRARFRARWLRELGSAAVTVVTDFGVLIAVLVRALRARRRTAGLFRWDASAAGDDPLAAGRRAWVEALATWSPNCYVIDIDPASGRRLIHDMRPRDASEQPR